MAYQLGYTWDPAKPLPIPVANTPMAMGTNYGVGVSRIPRANTPMAMGVNYTVPRYSGGTVARTLPGPKPPAEPPWMTLYKQALGMIETPAEAEARVRREVAEEIAAQQKLINDTYARQRADALAAMNAMSAAGAAAAAMSKGLIGAVGGEYNAAAEEISGLAGGLTGAFDKATAKEVSKANAVLGNLGAPGVTVGGVGGIGGGLQRGVEEYRGGTIPSQLFTEEGDAATFGLAGQTSAMNLKTTQEAQAAYQGMIHEINQNETNAIQALAANEPALAHQYLNEANDLRIKALTLASGIMSAGQSASGAGAHPYTVKVGNTLLQWDPVKHRFIPVAAAADKPIFKTVRGSLYQYDPRTGDFVLKIRAPAGANATKPITTKQGGVTYQWYPNPKEPGGGHWAVPPGLPTTAPPTTPKGSLNQNQINNMVSGWYSGKTSTAAVPVITGYTGTGNNRRPVYTSLPPGSKYWSPDPKDPTKGTFKVVPGRGATGRITYQQALRKLTALLNGDAVRAKTILDTVYRRGEATQGKGGAGRRPYLDVYERAALRRAGARDTPGFLTDPQWDNITAIYQLPDHTSEAFLTETQYRVLDRAGRVPPGRWVDLPATFPAGGRQFAGKRIWLITEGYD